ncbi:MAG: DUF6531 domain-containing protein, partial [Myxococcaceae bacterium]
MDAISPNQMVKLPCTTAHCAPGTDKVSGPSEPSAIKEDSITPATPLRQGAQRPARATTGLGRTIDTVDALPSMIPQIDANQKKHPIADGQVRDEAPNNSNAEPVNKITEDKPTTALDPVALMAGSLEITHTDLSFAGPARPLEFSRQYSSQGFDRSELGSNWAHNWDVRVIPLRHENLPDGVDPFCAGTPEETTCVMLRDGNSGKLYMRDRRDGLFKPQAGSFSTLMKSADGWYLRGPDFHVQRFDLDGYLVYDADRFGNAFKLEYELNAWGRLDEALCPDAVLRLDAQPGAWVDAMGPKYAASSLPCTLLSGLVGRTKPMVKSSVALDTSNFDLSIPNQPPPSSELTAARALLFASQPGGAGSASVWGQRKKRVKRVFEMNDQGTSGRSLEFTYWPDADSTLLSGSTSLRRAGLLQKVTGPAGAKVEFSYVAPALPERLNEALLTQVVRSDTNSNQPMGVVAGPVRTYSFTYASAAVAGTTMSPTQLADLRWRYTNYFVATRGCTYLTYDKCGNPLVPGFTAISDSEVDTRVDAFLSDVADNILTIVAPNETVETRYIVDPLSLSFDKVSAQRWGSSRVAGSTTLSPNWTTTLPEATLAYAEEGPDGTDSFLPSTFV